MIDIEQQDKTLKISYFNEIGEVEMELLKVPPEELYEWEYTKGNEKAHPTITSWDNKPVKKRKTVYLSKYRIEEYLADLGPQVTDKYNKYPPKKWFCDIETYVDDEWPKAETAKTPVTSITFCNTNKIVTLGTKPLTAKQIQSIKERVKNHFKDFMKDDFDYRYIQFDTEYDMLISFFHKAMHKFPLLTGWNFIGYDWQYMINRCKRLNIDPAMCSASKKLIGKAELPMHRIVVDYLEVYKKWDRVIDVKENNTLDYVANAALGINKVKFNGTLKELYDNDYESYIFYNVVDTKIVELIDNKLNTLETFLMLGNVTKVEANRAFSPIWMAEAVMARETYKRGQIFPKTDAISKVRESYEGAFVFEPKPGLYEWTASFDFASLYPSIMRQWDISPESYYKNILPNEEYDKTKYTKTSSGALFRKDVQSVFGKILTDLYGKRKEAKHEYQEIEKEIEYLKTFI